MNKNFEIIATIGPSCCDSEILKKMLDTGATSLRLNLSHLNQETINNYFRVLQGAKILPSIDTQGAQIRITNLRKERIQYCEGQEISIASNATYSENYHDMAINHSEVFEQLEVEDILKMDFDGVTAKIHKINCIDETIKATIISPGTITKNRAIDIDQKAAKLNAFTEFDKKILKSTPPDLYQDVYISFCNDKDDIRTAKEFIKQAGPEKGKSKKKYIAKIETVKGVQNLESILTEADAILVDRGDLSER